MGANKLGSALNGDVWAIMPEKLDALMESLEWVPEKAIGSRRKDEEENSGWKPISREEMKFREGCDFGSRLKIEDKDGTNTDKHGQGHRQNEKLNSASEYYLERAKAPEEKNNQGILIVPVRGVIEQRSTWLSELFGGTSAEKIGALVEAGVNDSRVAGIILDVDSPGGEVSGTPELSSKIFNLRGKKPIVAIANSLMASAAYWIGSAADEIVITPSGMAGSIGVLS